MDADRFDRVSKLFAKPRLSRRAALAAGAAGLGSVALRPLTGAQEATPVPSVPTEEEGPAFLFVQLAERGSWAPKPDEPGVYLLSLVGPGTQTLYFSDRPDRIVGAVPTDRFLAALGFTPLEPPNAAIVVETPEGERDVLVVELFNPVYTQEFDADGGTTLTYEARILEEYEGEGLDVWDTEQADAELAEGFGNVSLFIDDCPDLTSCKAILPGGGALTIGPIPGGPYGRCWSWPDFNCNPCSGQSVDYYNNLCNQTYPDCQGVCSTKCWAGLCV